MRPRVLVGVCGGIAAFKAAEVVRRLSERGFDTRCAMTRSARAFLRPLTLEVLSGHAVYEEEYLSATGRGEESHIAVADWADAICVVPATAHFLARLALGLADDFLTTTALAFAGPVIVAPAMHTEMWRQEATVGHVETLRRRGVVFAGPVEGPLASGEHGMGRLAAPLDVVAAVESSLGGDPVLAGTTVLVSAGPTHEPLDPVRFLGNRSSGKMGFALAGEAARRGARTILVSGPVALATPPGVERLDVETALEMRDAIHRHVAGADLVIMAAAVADFRPREVAVSKIKKRTDAAPTSSSLILELETNPDILTELADLAPGALRVGFAAETEVDEDAARGKLARKRADFLVWNQVTAPGVGFGADDNAVTLYRPGAEPLAFSRRSKRQLAGELLALFAAELAARRQRRAAEGER